LGHLFFLCLSETGTQYVILVGILSLILGFVSILYKPIINQLAS
jgi:hypothetical protein